MLATLRLPSDWLAVADMYVQQTRSQVLPAALRKALAAKFSQFSEYQLSK